MPTLAMPHYEQLKDLNKSSKCETYSDTTKKLKLT